MINILFISITSNIGGGPEHILSILKNIDRNQFNIIVVAPNDGEYFDEFSKYAETINIDLRHHFVRNFLKLSSLVDKNDIQICHSHGRGAGLYSRGLKLLRPKLKIVHTYHGIHLEFSANIIQTISYIFEILAGMLTNISIAVSQKEYEEAANSGFCRKSNLRLIYNGIEISKFDISVNKFKYLEEVGVLCNTTTKVIGCIARFDKLKGHHELIEAFSYYLKIFPESILLLIGDGTRRKLIEQQIQDGNMTNKIILLGFRRDVPELMKCCDMIVSASYKEGLPYTLIEALTAGIPVVATRTTGNDEIIIDGETGLLAKVKSPMDLFKKMKEITCNPTITESFLEKGQTLVRTKFSVMQMVESLSYIYNSLLINHDKE